MILPAVTGGGGGWNHQFDPDFRGQADPDSNKQGRNAVGWRVERRKSVVTLLGVSRVLLYSISHAVKNFLQM